MPEKTLEEIKSYEPLEDVTAETRDETKLRMREKEKSKEEVTTWIKQLRESAQSLATVQDLDAARMWGRNIDSGLERFGRVVLGLKSTDKE